MVTSRGYYITITAWFPKEKQTLKENREKNLALAESMKRPIEPQAPINIVRFDEFVEIQNLKKRSARDAYLMKQQYVKEEVARMEENEAYESEIMKKSEKKIEQRK